MHHLDASPGNASERSFLAEVSQTRCRRCLHVEVNDDRRKPMVRATRVPPADVSGIKGMLIERLTKKMLGEVPEPLGVMWHNQPVLKAFFGFSRKAEGWDA
jgi:hypothetical protein